MIGELAALGAALSWTISAVLYKEALSKTKPITANIVRLVCTGGILLFYLAIVGKLETIASLPMPAVLLASASGIIGLGIGDTLYMKSLDLMGVARAVPITCTYPLFTLMWGAVLRDNSITPQLLLGTLAIILGIWLLSQEKEVERERGKKILIKGSLAALATSVMWSISIKMIDMAVTLPQTNNLDSALAINVTRVSAIALVFLVSSPVVDRNLRFLKVQRRTLAVLAVAGLVALGVGWFLLTYSLVYTPESRAVPISSTTPLFSTLVSIVFLGERVTARSIAGSAIIVAAIFLIFAG